MSKADLLPPLAAPETNEDRRRLARSLSPVSVRAILELAVPVCYVAFATFVFVALYKAVPVFAALLEELTQ